MNNNSNSLMQTASHYEEDDAVDDDQSNTLSDESDPDYVDSCTDSDFDIVEETRSELSALSIEAKSKSGGDSSEFGGTDCDGDEKSLQDVVQLIQAGEIKKLKVDHCKAYLRKNGLRLSGNKDTLVQRIKEHSETVNGGGEKKYPVSSFVLNCKGDACTGDIVLFEQNVYEMFNIASRSASGPPSGKRLVAGRIIKESYGSAKQQHTFTIEVLWSKGEKPLPPLYPLLIKGRNLYRLKTIRQRWSDEGERQKVLMEKHSRGSQARSVRKVRIREKEMRTKVKAKKVFKDSTKNMCQPNKPIVESAIQPQPFAFEPRKSSSQTEQPRSHAASERLVHQYQQPDFHGNKGPPPIPSSCSGIPVGSERHTNQSQISNLPPGGSIYCADSTLSGGTHRVQNVMPNIYRNGLLPYFSRYSYENVSTRGYLRQSLARGNNHPHFPVNNCGSFISNDHRNELPRQRQPLSTLNYPLPVSPQKRDAQVNARKKLCRYYSAQVKCHFGDNCRFLHEGSSDQTRRY